MSGRVEFCAHNGLCGADVAGCVDRRGAMPGELPAQQGPMRRVLGLTWVGWLNMLVLRWFFVRLYYMVETDNTISGWGLHRWVWPFPWANWKRIGGPEGAP